MAIIPFNKFHIAGKELDYIKDAISQSKICGDNKYTKLCETWLTENLKTRKALLTPSCTAALEMAALLLGIKPGDEIIMPSFTFVSTANAFVLSGATPVFVDIDPQTQNITATEIEKAITASTKAIVIVHYAGIACDMAAILAVAKKHKIFVIEDAAHAIQAKYNDDYLGTLGDLATLSFHDTKNITCGEGGALLINNPELIERAEIIREKGTNRSKFFRGQVDKYTWVDIGSSYLQSELTAAFLFAQLEAASSINARRLTLWHHYYNNLAELAARKLIELPTVPNYAKPNGHLFYILLPDITSRQKLIDYLKSHNITASFHYVPLHSSPAGSKYGRYTAPLTNTDMIADRLVRLPLYTDLTPDEIDITTKLIAEFFVQ